LGAAALVMLLVWLLTAECDIKKDSRNGQKSGQVT
jgi:hypothetical protein